MSLLTSKSTLERELRDKYNVCRKWINIIGKTPDDLRVILERHKEMWKEGVQHPNFGPDKYGMFRHDSIENMSLGSVYLGNINGIWTHPGYFFEDKDFKYNNGQEAPGNLSDDYRSICHQYRTHLTANLRAMMSNVYDHGYNRDRICEALTAGFANISKPSTISGLKIKNESISDNKVLDVEFFHKGQSKNSTVVNIDGEFYMPQGFEKGVRIDPGRITDYKLVSLFDANNGNANFKQFSKTDLKAEITSDKKMEMSRKSAKENVRHVNAYSKSKGVKFGA